MQESVDDVNMTSTGHISVYPTVISTADGLHTVFERVEICKCSDMLEAVCVVFMLYFVFDVQYPSDIANTLNFLDTIVGRVTQGMKVRAPVQRKVNILLSQ